MGAHLAVRPPVDAVLATDLLERREADAELLRHGLFGHAKVL